MVKFSKMHGDMTFDRKEGMHGWNLGGHIHVKKKFGKICIRMEEFGSDRMGYGKFYLKSSKRLFVAIPNIILILVIYFVWNLTHMGYLDIVTILL